MTNLSALSWTTLCRGAVAMLLVALLVSASDASVVTNGSFETPLFSVNSHNYKDIPPTGWTHTGRSGIDNGNPFPGSNTVPYIGAQMAFLQGDDGWTDSVSSLGQTLGGLVVGETYLLSFQALGLSTYHGANPFNVSIDGTPLFDQQIIPNTSTYTQYISNTFVATANTMNLLFYDQADTDALKISFIDDVQVQVYETPLPNLVVNGTFETPVYDDPHHDYVGGIDGSGWTRTGRGGIDRGNPYGSNAANCSPYEGAQMGFLQDNMGLEGITTLAQDVSGFEVGQSYVLRFEAKAIDGFSGVNPINVSVGGVDLLTNVTPGTEYKHFSSDPFVATYETMSLVFYDIANVNSGDVTWIDDVRINPVPEPGMICLLLAGVFTAAGMVSRRRKRM